MATRNVHEKSQREMATRIGNEKGEQKMMKRTGHDKWQRHMETKGARRSGNKNSGQELLK